MTVTATRQLFGTDGIRAVAGENPLDPTTIYAVGLALAHTLRRQTADPAVILGRDTRESSPGSPPLSAPACALQEPAS